MKVIWTFVIVALIGLEYNIGLGAPLTKWFKTDNSTYYIEEQINYTFQQSFDECQKKNMRLITVKSYKEDDLLLKYLKQSFDPQPEFWLNAVEKFDMHDINKLLDSAKLASFLNIRMDGDSEPQIIQSNNPNNCAVTVEGANKDCDILRGFICYENNTKSGVGGQNVQNIVLKFN